MKQFDLSGYIGLGKGAVTWQGHGETGSRLKQGMYLAVLTAGQERASVKMMLMGN